MSRSRVFLHEIRALRAKGVDVRLPQGLAGLVVASAASVVRVSLRMVPWALLALVLGSPRPAEALGRCRAKMLADGTIVVSASDVQGTPRWGLRHGQAATAFDNAATCVSGGKAAGCTLAPQGDPARTALPTSCALVLADDGSNACSAWIRGCFASSEAPPCSVLPADNIWNRDVSSLPVHAQSAEWIQAIGSTAVLHPDFGKGPYRNRMLGIPYVVIPASQPTAAVGFLYADESDAGPYPVPALVPVEGGGAKPNRGKGDAHVLLVQEGTCRLWELYAARPSGAGAWSAGSGAVFDLGSNALRPDGWTSADAAGLPIFPGLVRRDEVEAGEIRHALRFTAPVTQRAYVWPARHYASSQTSTSLPPMGIRVRLKSSVDLSGFSPDNQVILSALRKYGMILADNGSPWFVSGAPDRRWDDDDLHQLQALHGDDFEVVDVSSLMVSPDSGATVP